MLKGLLELEMEMLAGMPADEVVVVVLLVAYNIDVLVRTQLKEERLDAAVDASEGLYVLYGKQRQVAEFEVQLVWTSRRAVLRLYSPRGKTAAAVEDDAGLDGVESEELER